MPITRNLPLIFEAYVSDMANDQTASVIDFSYTGGKISETRNRIELGYKGDLWWSSPPNVEVESGNAFGKNNGRDNKTAIELFSGTCGDWTTSLIWLVQVRVS